MLALSDRKGNVEASVPGLATVARVPREKCDEALRRLMSPDVDSRSQAFEGRRIAAIEGGWKILNYEKHRNKLSSEERREYKTLKQREYRIRDKAKKLSTNSTSGQNGHIADADAEADAKAEEPKVKTICAQASFAAPRLEPEFSLVLNTGEFHPVFKSDIERYKALYPAVDVEQSFRSMIGWLDADPKRRKTKNGIARFINGWLSREQDRGRRKRGNGESYGERRTRENAANLGLAGPAVPTRVL